RSLCSGAATSRVSWAATPAIPWGRVWCSASWCCYWDWPNRASVRPSITFAFELDFVEAAPLIDHQRQHEEKIAHEVAQARQNHRHLDALLLDPHQGANGLFAGGTRQMQLRYRHRAPGQHKAREAVRHLLAVMAHASIQPRQIRLAHRQPATNGAIGMKRQRLQGRQ